MSEHNHHPVILPRRAFLRFDGYPDLHVRPHREDAELLVAKSEHSELVDMALLSALITQGHEPEAAKAKLPDLILERKRGEHYHIAVITRDTGELLMSYGASNCHDPVEHEHVDPTTH